MREESVQQAVRTPLVWAQRRPRYLLDNAALLGVLFLAPAIVYMALFLGGPLILAVYFAITDINTFNLTGGYRFVGLRNFYAVLNDPIFRQALRNTFVFAIASQLVSLILGKVLALLLMRDFPLKKLVRTLILLPWAVPIALGTMAWRWMFDSLYSVINWTLRALHILGPDQWPQWLGRADLAMISIITVFAWRSIPFAAVMFLAGMTAVPQDIIDASLIDGAGFWRRTFQVILPIIAPIVMIALVFGTVFAFTDMSVVYLLTRGGPMNTTHVLGSYAFQVGIISGDIGMGAMIALFLLPPLLVAMVISLRILGRMEGL